MRGKRHESMYENLAPSRTRKRDLARKMKLTSKTHDYLELRKQSQRCSKGEKQTDNGQYVVTHN